MIRPLIAIPSPRDIDRVKNAIDLIHADKLWIKYYKPEIDAYVIMQREFLASEYTHLVIIPDDLVVGLEVWNKFMTDIEFFPNDIISGYCNLDRTFNSGFTNISPKLVQRHRTGRTYTWFSMGGLWQEAADYRAEHPELHKDLPEYMIDVPFAGFPLFAIPREIVRKIRFTNDSPSGYDPLGCCVDVTFCYDAIKAGYRILCDIRLRTEHLKIDDNQVEHFKAGLVQPYYKYDIFHKSIIL